MSKNHSKRFYREERLTAPYDHKEDRDQSLRRFKYDTHHAQSRHNSVHNNQHHYHYHQHEQASDQHNTHPDHKEHHRHHHRRSRGHSRGSRSKHQSRSVRRTNHPHVPYPRKEDSFANYNRNRSFSYNYQRNNVEYRHQQRSYDGRWNNGNREYGNDKHQQNHHHHRSTSRHSHRSSRSKYDNERKPTSFWRDGRGIKIEKDLIISPSHHYKNRVRSPVRPSVKREKSYHHDSKNSSRRSSFYEDKRIQTERQRLQRLKSSQEHEPQIVCPPFLQYVKREIDETNIVSDDSREEFNPAMIKIEPPTTPHIADLDFFTYDAGNTVEIKEIPETCTVVKTEVIVSPDHLDMETDHFFVTPIAKEQSRSHTSSIPLSSSSLGEKNGFSLDTNPILTTGFVPTVKIKQEKNKDDYNQDRTTVPLTDPRLERRRLHPQTVEKEKNPRDSSVVLKTSQEETFMIKIKEEVGCTSLAFLDSPFVTKIVPKKVALPVKPLNKSIEQVKANYTTAVKIYGLEWVLDILRVDEATLEKKEIEAIERKDDRGWFISHDGIISGKIQREKWARRRELYQECKKHYGSSVISKMIAEEVAMSSAAALRLEKPMKILDEVKILERLLSKAKRFPWRKMN